jgi:hypothetical protein
MEITKCNASLNLVNVQRQAMIIEKKIHNNLKDVPCQKRRHSTNNLYRNLSIIIKHNSCSKL